MSNLHPAEALPGTQPPSVEAQTGWYPSGYCMSTTLLQNYREFMRGVDKGDQLQTYYNAGKRSRKWWKRISFTSLKLLS